MSLKHLLHLLEQEKPDIIFCTQSVPSYLLNKLKQSGHCQIHVVNVYTDFVVSQFWSEGMLRMTALHNFARNILIAGGNLGLMNCTNL
ncbi:MGDG synthase family glycosyltransferase [Lysinibacillus piscis]|uniref:Diacylglycerol glucosyltransferase N-terminal domain-containing protein n=1 Tax=Lysinibacillus piscis TaxID=2518931 RepID=A0ABQ5NMH0_9BACI|nr:hypothetical protein [Lysinibacillus sp. KH24]GLC89566.1 hypothetical protein LYSBPC_26930 [Lysinibacillus sp. KH24]